MLQTIIRRDFARRTVITIAHRINTIMDSDHVAVVADGRVVEYGTPRELLQRPESLFAARAVGDGAAVDVKGEGVVAGGGGDGEGDEPRASDV